MSQGSRNRLTKSWINNCVNQEKSYLEGILSEALIPVLIHGQENLIPILWL